MCGGRKGLQALVSKEGCEYYFIKELSEHSKTGWLMCSKTLATLYDNHIEDEPGNPGWLNFFALDADKKIFTGHPLSWSHWWLPSDSERDALFRCWRPQEKWLCPIFALLHKRWVGTTSLDIYGWLNFQTPWQWGSVTPPCLSAWMMI